MAAECTLFKGSFRCDTGASCTGHWSHINNCDSGAACLIYHSDGGDPCTYAYTPYCTSEHVVKPSDKQVSDFFKFMLDSDVRTISLCSAGDAPYYDDMPGAKCYFNSLNAKAIASAINSYMETDAVSCRPISSAYTFCKINDFGFLPVYRRVVPDFGDPPSNTDIFKHFNTSKNAYVSSVKECINGHFDNDVYRSGFYCSFEKLSPDKIQASLSSTIGYDAYSCALHNNNEVLCTIRNQAALYALYMNVKNSD